MSPQPPPQPDQSGQFVAIRTGGWAAWCIRVGTRSRWNHAAIVSGQDVIEANPGGVDYGRLNSYRNKVVSRVDLTPTEREAILEAARGMIGVPYSWLDIVALALSCTVGVRLPWVERRLASSKSVICSQLVAECYAAAGITLVAGKPAYAVTPGDLADVILGAHVPVGW